MGNSNFLCSNNNICCCKKEIEKIIQENNNDNNNDNNNNYNNNIETQISCYNINLDEFMKEMEYQIDDKQRINDEVFSKFKEEEIRELEKEFSNNKEKYENDVMKKESLNLSIDDNFISTIIDNEDSDFIYKKKIIDKIIKITNDDQQYKIDYLTILLVGRKGVGKTTLINYMLEINDGDTDTKMIKQDNCVSYQSKKVPYLKLVEFKGIGLDKNSDPETIGKNTIDYIQNIIKDSKKNNYNDFVHCIWYCITGSRFENTEIAVLEKLKQVYEDSIMPIIVVYTQTDDEELAYKMNEYIINEKKIETIFVKVMVKDMKIMNNQIKKAFGKKELLNTTLDTFKTALKGDMINLMINKMSIDIEDIMIKENKEKGKELINKIIDEFKKYKLRLSGKEFINYIINMLGKNLIIFYQDYITNISNLTLNFIYNSNVISEIRKKISLLTKNSKATIESITIKKALEFINLQACKEISKMKNMEIKNKRTIKKFKKTNEIFLKNNFYYILQKYIIYNIINNFYKNYFIKIRNELDSIVKKLLSKNEEEKEIKSYLISCFFKKLKNFGNERNINLEIDYTPEYNDLPGKNEINQEELYQNDNDNNLFNIDSDIDNEDEKIYEPNYFENNNKKWFPIIDDNNWKFINKENIDKLNKFLQNIEIQYSEKDKNNHLNSDTVFKSLNEYIEKDLIFYFQLKKEELINKIDSKYNSKIIEYNKKLITDVIERENFKSICTNKIKEYLKKIEKKKDKFNIEHISIILVGKSGVGKSALINCMLKDDLAEEGAGNIVTQKNESFQSQNIPFLRFIDTRGIELNQEYGANQILNETHKIIDNENTNAKNSNNYNDYIQCIWYCVGGDELEQKEIDIINDLIAHMEQRPLIIVFPRAINKDHVKKMKEIVGKKFPNIPFVHLVGRNIEKTVDSSGRDEILNETIKACTNTIKGDVFRELKEKLVEYIINRYKETNEKKKMYLNNNKIIDSFTSGFKKVLTDNELKDYMSSLLDKIFIKYMNDEEEKNKK